MRLTGSRAYYRPSPPKMPPGLVELMEGLTKEVLKHNPSDIYGFCTSHMQQLLDKRDGPPLKKSLSLEQKIAKAQEMVRQRAENRRQECDLILQQQSSNDIDGGNKNDLTLQVSQFPNVGELRCGNIVSEDDKEISSQDQVSQHIKSPVHHEQALEGLSEVEISHKSVLDIATPGDGQISEKDLSVKNVDMKTNSGINEDNNITSDVADVVEPTSEQNNDNIKQITSANNEFEHESTEKHVSNLETAVLSTNVVAALPPELLETNQSDENVKDDLQNDNVKIDQEQSNQVDSTPSNENGVNSTEHVPKSIETGDNTESVEKDVGKTIEAHASSSAEADINNDISKSHEAGVLDSNETEGIKNENLQSPLLSGLDEDSNKREETTGDIEPQNSMNTEESSAKDLPTSPLVENTLQSKDTNIQPEDANAIQNTIDNNGETSENLTEQENKPVTLESTTDKDAILRTDGEKDINSSKKLEVIEVSNAKTSQLASAKEVKNTEDKQLNATKDRRMVSSEQANMADSEIESHLEMATTVVDCDVSTLVTENLEKDSLQADDLKKTNSDEEDVDKLCIGEVTSDSESLKKHTHEDIKNDSNSSSAPTQSTEAEYEDSANDETSDNMGEVVKHDNNDANNMDLETAAITIQKVFRTFLFKSRGSTFEDSANDETNFIEEDDKNKAECDYPIAVALNIDRRTHGITRMDTVLQTVNEEKSLSLSDDSSTLSSAATIIQAHVRGFLVRSKLNSNKTISTNSLAASNSNEPSITSLEVDTDQNKNKTILNIHIVPEGENYLSRDESLITSMDLSLDSPPSSINLHPLGYDKSERRKQLKREDAIQSVSPPSNNSGKLSEDFDSVKELSLNDNDLVAEHVVDGSSPAKEDLDKGNDKSTLLDNGSMEKVANNNEELAENINKLNDSETHLKHKRKSLTKMSSDEMDVVTPFIADENSASSKLMHSGEFHDAVLPTRLSRSDTAVVSGE